VLARRAPSQLDPHGLPPLSAFLRLALPMTLLFSVLAPILVLLVFVVLLPSLLIRRVLAPLNPGVVFSGPGGQKQLALSIDDGPSGPGSEALLALLRQLEVPATFFLIGSHLQCDQRFPRRALQQGHELGNHLWRDERAAAPVPITWRWFRPGGGWFHPAMLGWLAARPYRLVLGSIFPWDTLRPPLWFVRLFIRINVHPGGILVLHDTPALSGRTLEILRSIVPELRRRGYRFVPLKELLDPAP